jgi:hypothetical protein
VIHDFATKGAFWHFVGKNHADGYSPVDGWRCTLFHGHSTCKRGRAVIKAEPLVGAGTPGTAHLSEFLSPDKSVWCLASQAGPPEMSCRVFPETGGTGFRAGVVDASGRVSVCNKPAGGTFCNLGYNKSSAILRYGQRTEANGVRCDSASNGITCAAIAGAGKGHGFRINKGEAVRVG